MNLTPLKIKAARHGGLLIGCTLGLFSGLHIFGLAVGALVGYFIDELIYTRKIVNKSAYLIENPSLGVLDERWTKIVLSMALASGATVVTGLAGKKLLEEKISRAFGLGRREIGLLGQLIERLSHTGSIDRAEIDDLTAFYNTISSDNEKLALLELLISAATGESGRITSEQNEMLKTISVTLGVSPDAFNTIRQDAIGVDAEAYDIIGLAPDADDSEIHKVYRRLAAQFHPDTFGELNEEQRSESTEAFLKIQDAYNRIVADRNALRTDGEHGEETS